MSMPVAMPRARRIFPSRRRTAHGLATLSLVLVACGGGAGGGQTQVGPGSGGGPTPPACVTPTGPAPRTTFSFLGGQPTNLVYDPTRQLIWATNTVLNEVDVVDLSGTVQGRIPVPEPVGIDIMADGSAIVIGTETQYLYLADPDHLRVTERVHVPSQSSFPNYALAPVLVLTSANGNVLVFAETGNVIGQNLGESAILEWNPISGVFRDRTSEAQLPGIIARSADHSLIAIGNAVSPGHLVAYYSASDSFAISADDFGGNFARGMAVNTNGTQIAAWGFGLEFFDQHLNLVSTVANPTIFPIGLLGATYGGAVFSQDGSKLYGSIGTGDLAAPPWGLAVMDMGSMSVSEAPYGHDGIPSAVASSGLVLTTGTAGIGFVDPSRAPVPAQVDLQKSFPNLTPGNGSLNQVNFDHFSAADNVYVGTQPACNNGVAITVPASASPGPRNVTGVSPTGWIVVGANAFSYGPALRQLSPNAAPATGGTTVQIFGYGLNYSPTELTVTIGGQQAKVIGAGYSNQGDESDIDAVQAVVPAGTPGWADVTVTTPDGTDILPHGLYYAAESVYGGAQGFTQLVLDRTRQRVYGLGAGTIAVFDISSGAFLAPLVLPGISSGAILTSMALSPDGATLLVGDNTDRKILVLDPDTPATVKAISMPSVSGCVMVPGSMAVTSLGTVMVVTNCNEIEELNLSTETFATALVTVSQSPLAATPDGTAIWNGAALWTAASGKFVAEPGSLGAVESLGVTNTAISGDGLNFEMDGQASPVFLGSDFALTNVATLPDYVLGSPSASGGRFDSSGALFFLPLTNGIDVFDRIHGQLQMRIPLPEAIAGTLGPNMVLDDSNNTLYVLTNSGIEAVGLGGGLPLSIAGVKASGVIAVGASITVQGAGFVVGAKVELNGVTTNSTVVDSNTMQLTIPQLTSGPVQIVVTNPDGRSYRWDAAFNLP